MRALSTIETMVALGALTACSYEFGGDGASAGGEGGASKVYVASNGPASSGQGTTSVGMQTTTATTDAGASSVDVSSATTGNPAVCGNGIVEPGETCDGNEPAAGSCIACLLCNGGAWEPVDRHCYIYGTTNDGQSDAAGRCSAWMEGAHLADPKNSGQMAAIGGLVPGGDVAYIGVRRSMDVFVYSDGTAVTWQSPPWLPLSPAELLDCVGTTEVVIDGWASAGCENLADEISGYVCEWAPPAS